jgi:flagellar biogenesis protein FliO
MRLSTAPGRLPNRYRIFASSRWNYAALAGVLLVVVIAGVTLLGNGATGQPADSGIFVADAADEQPLGMPTSDSSLWSSIWPIIAMILVLGALYGSLYLLRAATGKGQALGDARRLVSLQTSVRLGNNQTLHVVQFGEQHLLLGSSQAGLTVLDKSPVSQSDPRASNFDVYLDDVLSGEAGQ